MNNKLYPARDSRETVVSELVAQLPITSQNDLVAALNLYHNTVHNTAHNMAKTEPYCNPEPYWNPDSHWEVHDDYTPKDWAHEVAENDTRQSYIDWVNSQIDGDMEYGPSTVQD